MLNLTIIVVGLITILYALSFWLISKRGDAEKLSTYENGFNPIGDARKKFDIIYWIIGLLYLIFDLEIIFIFPFIAVVDHLDSLISFWSFMSFLLILGMGFIYEYLEGALNILPVSDR